MGLAAWALLAGLTGAPGSDCAGVASPGTEALIRAAARASDAVWTVAFAQRGMTYRPPRLLMLCRPVGHPARGSGYDRHLGLLVDLGDMSALRQVLRADANPAIALIVAHETGHHVHALLRSAQTNEQAPDGLSRERQADCYAGWALAHEDVATPAFGGSEDELYAILGRTVRTLESVQTGALAPALGAADAETHGSLRERVNAIGRGLRLHDPWRC